MRKLFIFCLSAEVQTWQKGDYNLNESQNQKKNLKWCRIFLLFPPCYKPFLQKSTNTKKHIHFPNSIFSTEKKKSKKCWCMLHYVFRCKKKYWFRMAGGRTEVMTWEILTWVWETEWFMLTLIFQVDGDRERHVHNGRRKGK